MYDRRSASSMLWRALKLVSMMRALIVVGLALVAVTVSVSAAASRGRSKAVPACPPLGAHMHTVAADSQAVLYEAPETPELAESLALYGCATKSGRSVELGHVPEDVAHAEGGVRLVRLVGTMVAAELSDEGYWVVKVWNLSSRRMVHRVPTGRSTNPEPSYNGGGSVEALVLKPDGSVAWIFESVGAGLPGHSVEAADANGVRLLATGTEIAPHSLALGGSTVYWTQGGKPYSAPLK